MAKIYTTEITSEQIPSDNPIHQRLYKAYIIAENFIHGDVLEVGCGEGRGIDVMLPKAKHFTAVDKIVPVITELQQKYPTATFKSMNIPPLNGLADNTYDAIVSFQVIEHIQDDKLFLREIHRVLKPGGIALLTTPNRKMSLTRNPWHIREYLPEELKLLAESIFREVKLKGISGNAKVMAYYEQNKRSVEKLTRYDVFNLQYRLPAALLRLPYELLNRYNRNKLHHGDHSLVMDIHHDDYMVVEDASDALDLLLIVSK
ncbi:MAG TPA: class I SAM-dependent methyltransferase [Ohtaekwangia sp.]|nr:class I SAM-dependent methyltransferase [Ohtaekwangia sp.]